MKTSYREQPNGYLETIQKGMSAVRYFNRKMSYGKGTREEQICRLKKEIEEADAIMIGAGAGLSTSAGFTYSGERFQKYFSDFEEKYGFHDMYSGGFYVMRVEPEISWAYWARNIYINRYMKAAKPVYERLLTLVKEKDYFVITTNVDHQFQKAGFDKKRLFYTQGDYGLMKAMEAQGFIQDEAGVFHLPEDGKINMRIPFELIPKCPDGGSDVAMNLRADDSFVEDEGWHRASAAYSDFIRRHEGLHVLYLELGVGANTPVIIKYPFWQMTLKEAFCPGEIENRSICIDGDIGEVLGAI